MKITVVCVGKIKEKFYTQAIAEYSKRLSRYCTLQIKEVADEKTPEHASEATNQQIKEKEGDRILAAISDGDYCIALAIEGEMLDSLAFSARMEDLGVHGNSSLTFVIGGSLGLDPRVLQRAEEKISFSRMTFPHQLMRVILLEQIYRGFRIMRHEPYHK